MSDRPKVTDDATQVLCRRIEWRYLTELAREGSERT